MKDGCERLETMSDKIKHIFAGRKGMTRGKTASLRQKIHKNNFFMRRFYYLLAFFIPLIVVTAADIALGVHPFGDRAVLIIDSYHQYAPFFSDFYDKIVNGGSLLYSWNGGLGINFWAVVAYYLASPLNMLMLLVPRGFLIEAFTVIIILKISLSGLSFAYYISKHYRKYDVTIIYFSIFYALSGWVLGYNWNIMWLDCIFIFPVIILGLERLVREGRGFLYGVSLALCIICNYYISIMICMFLVFYFFVLFFQKRRKSFKLFISRGLKFAGYSLLAGGSAAVLLIPAFYALMQTHSAESSFPTVFKFYKNFWDILSQHMAVVEPTDLSGMPNLYCGVIVLMFAVLYMFRPRTPLSHKILKPALLIFMIFSCNVNFLDYIWHGFHYPNSLPNRFTFIYIFLLLTMCYEVFLVLRQYKIWQYFTAFIISMLFIIGAYVFGDEKKELYVYIITMVLLWLYFLLMNYYKARRDKLRLLQNVWLFVFVLEVAGNGIFGLLSNGSVGYSSYNKDLKAAEKIHEMTDDTSGFYRTELNEFAGRNNITWLGFKGVSMFSSTLSDGLDTLMGDMGLFAAVNKFSFEGSTEVTDTILGVKYLLSDTKTDHIRDFRYMDTVDHKNIYVNPYAAQLGFLVSGEYARWDTQSPYPWLVLNDFAKKAAQISDDIYTEEYISGEPAAKGGTVVKNGASSYTFTKGDGTAHELIYTIHGTDMKHRYIYFKAPHMDKLTVESGGVTKSYSDTRGHIVDIGRFGAGETVTLTFKLDTSYTSADVSLYMFGVNENALSDFYGAVTRSPMFVTEYSDTNITAYTDAAFDGIMYTSIPYDKGWHVKVDGKETEIKSVNGGLLYFEISEGEHKIQMSYRPQGFNAGFTVSAISLFIFTVIYFRNKTKRINLAKKHGRC